MNLIDGMLTEFEWNMFPGFATLGLFEKIESLMRDLQCETEKTHRITFMSMYNDVAWGEKGNTETCEYNSQTFVEYARRVPRFIVASPHGDFFEPAQCLRSSSRFMR